MVKRGNEMLQFSKNFKTQQFLETKLFKEKIVFYIFNLGLNNEPLPATVLLPITPQLLYP